MVFEKIKEILCKQFLVDEDLITPETDLVEDLGADSLDSVDLVMSLEDEFEIEFPEVDVERFRTVKDIVSYVKENM